jgi:hypothetical protein
MLTGGCFTSTEPPTPSDPCFEEGLYGNGECDDFCPERDPDCAPTCPDPDPADPRVRYLSMSTAECDGLTASTCRADERFFDNACGCGCIATGAASCPDPADPEVHYVSRDPAMCAVVDFACGEGQTAFDIVGCGCGCVGMAAACHDRSDPNVRYLADEPEVCAVIDVACNANERYFSDPCGCGCILDPSCADPNDPGVRYIATNAEVCAAGLWKCVGTRFDDACGCGCRAVDPDPCATDPFVGGSRTETYCTADPACEPLYTELCDCTCAPHPRYSGGGCAGTCGPECFVYDRCVAADPAPRCPNPVRPNVDYAGFTPMECAAVDFFCDDASLSFDNECGCGCIQL